jgi:hypothetical protein
MMKCRPFSVYHSRLLVPSFPALEVVWFHKIDEKLGKGIDSGVHARW